MYKNVSESVSGNSKFKFKSSLKLVQKAEFDTIFSGILYINRIEAMLLEFLATWVRLP